jgi:hypothetical protein
MGRESNLRCPDCGEILIATEELIHIFYICISSKCSDKIFAVKGSGHYFKCDEIDILTGKVIRYNP